MNRQQWHAKMTEEIAAVGVADAHEHILGRGQRELIDPDLFDWIEASYYYSVLLGSGMSAEEFRSRGAGDDARRWEILKPHLQRTRTSSYAHMLDLAFRDLFDFPFASLDDHNWDELSKRIKDANRRKDWFEVVLGEKMNVKHGLLDRQVGGTMARGVQHPGGWYDYILNVRHTEDEAFMERHNTVREIDTTFFKPVYKIDTLLYGYHRACISEFRRLFDVDSSRVETLDEYSVIVDRCFERIVEKGGVGIKSVFCGLRPLAYPSVDKVDAEAVFDIEPSELRREHVEAFENHVMHLIVQKSIEYGLPFQFHTGTNFSGFSPDSNSRPDHLFSLIAAYPEARFELFHGGFPFENESATLAGRFPNVYLNLTWFTMLAPTVARRALGAWIEIVPMHKFTWGGDCVYVEETYGSFLLALRVVADALYDKIEDGWLDQATALSFARGIFLENAVRLFGLEGANDA